MNDMLKAQVVQATMYSIMGRSDRLNRLIVSYMNDKPLLTELLQLTDTTRQQVYSNTFEGQQ